MGWGHLKANGIDTGLHIQSRFIFRNATREPRRGSLPVTERVAAEILSLPTFPGLDLNSRARSSSR
jgi:dTDP-4-amino-4,6-dideoxygalactose transaminase